MYQGTCTESLCEKKMIYFFFQINKNTERSDASFSLRQFDTNTYGVFWVFFNHSKYLKKALKLGGKRKRGGLACISASDLC